MTTGLKYLAIHHNLKKYFELLEDGECKRLILNLLEYSESGELPDVSNLHNAETQMLYFRIAENVENSINQKANDRRRETSATNGSKGGRPHKDKQQQQTSDDIYSQFSFQFEDGIYHLTNDGLNALKAQFKNKDIDVEGELSIFSAKCREKPGKGANKLEALSRWLNSAKTKQEKQREKENNAKNNPALNYAQRTYTDKDFEHGFFEDLDNQPEDQPTDNTTNEPTDSTRHAQQGSESLRTLPEP